MSEEESENEEIPKLDIKHKRKIETFLLALLFIALVALVVLTLRQQYEMNNIIQMYNKCMMNCVMWK